MRAFDTSLPIDAVLGDLTASLRARPNAVLVAPPGAGDNAATLLLGRAATPEQAAFIGNQAGGRVFLFLRTDDFWRDYEAMTAKGVRFIRPPAEQPYGTVAVFEDLYGNLWDLIGPANP